MLHFTIEQILSGLSEAQQVTALHSCVTFLYNSIDAGNENTNDTRASLRIMLHDRSELLRDMVVCVANADAPESADEIDNFLNALRNEDRCIASVQHSLLVDALMIAFFEQLVADVIARLQTFPIEVLESAQ